MTQTIGWIGVGSMGHRMTTHLLAAGIRSWLQMPSAPNGRLPAATDRQEQCAEAAALADIIILPLPDGMISGSRCARNRGVLCGGRLLKTVNETLTIGIKAAEAVAATLSQR